MKRYISLFILLLISLNFSACSHKQNNVNSKVIDNTIQNFNTGSTQVGKELQEKPVDDTSKINKNLENTKKDKSVSSSDSTIKEINGFVLLSSLDKAIVIDLKYATTDNFTKKVVYQDNVCVLRKSTAEKLQKANNELMKLGYRIKVWDAYRPVYVQKIFWDMVKDSRYVANPNTGGSIHNKGCAVDITLVDKDGNEVIMPSKFDDFSFKAYRTNSKMTNEAKKNMDLLTMYMVSNGFTTIDTEWWHFDDVDSKKYKISDINLKLFLGKKWFVILLRKTDREDSKVIKSECIFTSDENGVGSYEYNS